MAITQNPLTSGTTTTAGTSFATASVDPGDNRYVVITVVGYRTLGAEVAISATGNGITYALTEGRAEGSYSMSTFRGMNASPSAGAITVTYTSSHTRMGWAVSEFIDTAITGDSGADADKQSADNYSASANSLSVTLATNAVGSATYGAFFMDGPVDATPGDGFTQIHEVTDGAVLLLMTQWKASTDTSVDATYSVTSIAMGIALEIGAPGVSASAQGGRSMTTLGYT